MPDFLDLVRSAMEEYFGADARRIGHALRVAGHARELLANIEADRQVTMTAAYFHDIGIPEAERKYGSCAAPYQEKEGPPVARSILEKLDAPLELLEAVCALVGSHHTPAAIDSPEFRILWDADALVNLEEVLPGKSSEEIEATLDRRLVTEAGRRRGRSIYL